MTYMPEYALEIALGLIVTSVLLWVPYEIGRVTERVEWCDAIDGTFIDRECYLGVEKLELNDD